MLEPGAPRDAEPPTRPWQRRVGTWLWRALALLSLCLGLLGVVLPVLPTVPFLIVSAWAASQGWPAFEIWLLNHRLFGPPILQWRERGAVPRRAKWASSIMMGCTAVGMQFFTQIPLWLRLGVPAVMLAVAIWLWLRPEA